MNSWTLKLTAFFASLLIGVATVSWLFLSSRTEPEAVDSSLTAPRTHTQESPDLESLDTFDPEFVDLPNFDDDEPSPPDGKIIEIFESGIYRRSETYARNGQAWLVLTNDGRGKYALTSVRASVKLLNSVSWPGEEKDAHLSFKTSRPIVFAVRAIEGVTPGSTITLFDKPSGALDASGYPDTEEISDGYRREFALGSNTSILRTSRGVSKDGTKLAVLVVESEGQSQVIKRAHHVSTDNRDIIGSLHWAGDLDRDGRLDLYVSEFNEKGYTRTELYLSSQANPGDLVGLAAVFAASGC